MTHNTLDIGNQHQETTMVAAICFHCEPHLCSNSAICPGPSLSFWKRPPWQGCHLLLMFLYQWIRPVTTRWKPYTPEIPQAPPMVTTPPTTQPQTNTISGIRGNATTGHIHHGPPLGTIGPIIVKCRRSGQLKMKCS